MGQMYQHPKLSLKRSIFLLLSVLYLSLPGLIFRQRMPPPDTPTIENPEVTSKDPKPAELSTYKLQVGDSFVVTVDGYPEYSKERVPVPVQQDGYVSYPLIGLIKAVNLTVSELEAEMQSRFFQASPDSTCVCNAHASKTERFLCSEQSNFGHGGISMSLKSDRYISFKPSQLCWH